MKTIEEMKKVMANYVPDWFNDQSPYGYLNDCMREGEKPHADIMERLFDRWMASKKDPCEEALIRYYQYLSDWHDELDQEEVRLFLGPCYDERYAKPIEDSDKQVRFQVGTSQIRAENFVKEGLGFVQLENKIGTPDWKPVDRIYGLQVSICGSGSRSEFDRLDYYADSQASKLLDKPVVLTGLIEEKYLYHERNDGEYALSRKFYDKIQDPEIMVPSNYQRKYM